MITFFTSVPTVLASQYASVSAVLSSSRSLFLSFNSMLAVIDVFAVSASSLDKTVYVVSGTFINTFASSMNLY